MSDKTEAPTPRRLRKARIDGDSPVSSYLSQSLAFVVAVILLPGAVRALWARSGELLHRAFAAASHASPESFRSALVESGGLLLALVVPFVLAVGAVGAFTQLVQTGGVVAAGRLAPKLERLDVVQGLRRLVSPARLFAVARALFAGGLAALLAFAGLRDHAIDFARTSGRWAAVGVVIGGVGTPLLWRVALVCVALGALDLLVTRQAWIRRLRMTKDEVTREQKESEGDPHMKAARARAHRELLTQAAIASVRTANVVVVNPIHLACALRYDERAGDPAPVVVASGEGEIAAEIARAAWTFAVPLVTDVPLARALYELAVGETIPETLYEAVAEVLRELGSRQPRPDPPRAAS